MDRGGQRLRGPVPQPRPLSDLSALRGLCDPSREWISTVDDRYSRKIRLTPISVEQSHKKNDRPEQKHIFTKSKNTYS